jgi:P-type Cu2+ transporter
LRLGASLAQHSLHPVSRALLSAAADVQLISVANVKERAGLGLEACFDLPQEGVSGLLRLGSSSYCQVDEARHVTDLNGASMRVYLADSSGWMASFEFVEALRCDAAKTVAQLQARGYSVQMLSGDTSAAAQRVAGQLGIAAASAHGACTPDDKLARLKVLQAQGRHVLMVGDGLNDGPILAAAHASLAVGAAVPLAQAQSDFVMPGANLLMLPTMLSHAKRTMQVVKQNLVWAAIYNASCVPLALAGYLPAWLAGLGMALSSLLVIANAARLSTFKASN